MTSSLVGSEMCIRDSDRTSSHPAAHGSKAPACQTGRSPDAPLDLHDRGCLLYTSDAADDM
eukprot:4766382-Prorocentrum_lima.AAC.1